MGNQDMELLGSYNGLALINVRDGSGYHEAVVINPITLKAVGFNNPVSHFYGSEMSFGLGYNSVEDDYKIVFLWFNESFGSSTHRLIFSLKTRSSEGDKSSELRYVLDRPAVNVGGNLHWLAYKKDGVIAIISLDLCETKLKEVPFPTGFVFVIDLKRYKLPRCELAVMGGCLAILDMKVEGIDVWIREKSGEDMSWRKFTISNYPDSNGRDDKYEVICRLGESEFVLAKNYKELVSYDCETKVWRTLVIDGLPKYFRPEEGTILTFRESLVCPPRVQSNGCLPLPSFSFVFLLVLIVHFGFVNSLTLSY